MLKKEELEFINTFLGYLNLNLGTFSIDEIFINLKRYNKISVYDEDNNVIGNLNINGSSCFIDGIVDGKNIEISVFKNSSKNRSISISYNIFDSQTNTCLSGVFEPGTNGMFNSVSKFNIINLDLCYNKKYILRAILNPHKNVVILDDRLADEKVEVDFTSFNHYKNDISFKIACCPYFIIYQGLILQEEKPDNFVSQSKKILYKKENEFLTIDDVQRLIGDEKIVMVGAIEKPNLKHCNIKNAWKEIKPLVENEHLEFYDFINSFKQKVNDFYDGFYDRMVSSVLNGYSNNSFKKMFTLENNKSNSYMKRKKGVD